MGASCSHPLAAGCQYGTYIEIFGNDSHQLNYKTGIAK